MALWNTSPHGHGKCPYCTEDGSYNDTKHPTAWQNFRYDVYDWIRNPGVIFALAVSVIMFLLVYFA